MKSNTLLILKLSLVSGSTWIACHHIQRARLHRAIEPTTGRAMINQSSAFKSGW